MNQTIPLLSMPVDPERGLLYIQETLREAGFDVRRSFDFQDARAAHLDCRCPHHGTELCTCQMVVLLVYGSNPVPATLILHGHEGITRIALVDVPGGRPDGALATNIQDLFQVLRWTKPFHPVESNAP